MNHDLILRRRANRIGLALTTLLATSLLLSVWPPPRAYAAPSSTIFAVTTGNAVLRFDSAAPGTILSTTAITGMQASETLLGIDFRPATGQLYGLGSTSRLYAIDTTTGAATLVGTGPFATALSGVDFGVDFNPTVDRLRVVSDADQNLRLNPNNGTLAALDNTLAYAVGDPHVGANPNVVGSAYTNNFAGAATTTLYAIDSNLDILAIQNPPNSGILNTVGSLGVNTSGLAGFDIAAGSTAFASLTVGGVVRLFTINLSTGAATLVGSIGTGTIAIRDIAVVPEWTVYLPFILK
jgi:hypothetical protein